VVKPAVQTVRDRVIEIRQGGIEDENSPKYAVLRKSLKTLVDYRGSPVNCRCGPQHFPYGSWVEGASDDT